MESKIKHVFILNPAAGKSEGKADLHTQIEQVCSARGVDYEIHLTSEPGEATTFVNALCAREPDTQLRFYACGGDGTLSETVNGAYGHSNAAVGVIPVGTGNDFVRNFEGKQAFLDIDAQLDGQTRMLDLIRYNDRLCVNMINIGFDCEVVKRTAKIKRSKLVPPGMGYIAGLVITLLRKPGVKAQISLDGAPAQKRNMLLTAVANGAWCGGGFHSSPLAHLDDGVLDVLMIKNVSRVRFVSLVKAYKSGAYIDQPRARRVIDYAKVHTIRYTFAAPQSVCVDGEVIELNELELGAERNALCMIVPRGAAYAPAFEPAPVGAC